MLALLAPGQGAQTPGFLTPWLEVPGFTERLDWLSAVAGLDLRHHGTEADADTIRDTAVAQPLLVASGLLGALALFPQPADAYKLVGAAAGHSVGEITAAAGSGVITAEQAMVFVRERGNAMAEASAATPTGMTALLGGDRDAVLAKLEEHGLTPANDNGSGQIVAAGTTEQLEALQADPPEGARLRPLSVAGAFHTHHMAPAVARLEHLSSAISTHDPRLRLLSNADGAVVHDGRDVLARLVGQVSAPVRWDLVMRTLGSLGVTGVIEVPPAGTLTGLVKRGLKGVDTCTLKTPDDLDEARAFAERHGSPNLLDDAPTWRLVVAPFGGTFKSGDAELGETLPPGAPVGAVVNRRDSRTVTAASGGTLIEWLVEDGDPVSPGQPLLRLHPEEVPA
ncbi:MAG: acyltransferase domain-containing protein [Actinomycetes bacterium]